MAEGHSLLSEDFREIGSSAGSKKPDVWPCLNLGLVVMIDLGAGSGVVIQWRYGFAFLHRRPSPADLDIFS
jgi:hypothetical protein